MEGVTTTFESTHDINLHGCDESMAAASDNNPAENVRPFAFCSHICGACLPVPFQMPGPGDRSIGPWFKTAESVVDAGERVLTEDSYFRCETGAKVKVEFEDAGQDSIRVGKGKTIKELLEEKAALVEQIKHGHPYSMGGLQEELNALDEELQPRIDNIPYNVLQQTSSHNSYDTDDHKIGMKEQFEQYETHSFEIDIHNGDPIVQIGGSDNTIPNDFYVYHANLDKGTRYFSFSESMNEIGALKNTYPVTVFVDLKDELNSDGDQSSAIFDQILEDSIGSEKLYTPQDLIDKAQAVDPSISNLADAIAEVGWPTLGELNGRVMVVGTDNIGSYTGSNAFVAGKPHIENGQITDEDMIFFNIGRPKKGPWGAFGQHPYSKEDKKILEIIAQHDLVARGYYFNGEDNFEDGLEVGLNHITTNDIEEGDWTDLSTAGFPFRILDKYLEEEAECKGGSLAVVTGATLTCPKAVHPADVKFFRMRK